MKLSDVVAQLRSVLPRYTDLFTTNLAVVLTFSGGVVTATSTTIHGLETGDYTTITDAVFPTSIISINRIGSIATAVTSTDHDLTLNYHKTVNISGSDQSEYNGDLTLLSVPNRKTFTFKVSGTPDTPATGTINLNEIRQGYNGRFQVTKVSDLIFTYPIVQSPNGSSTGKSKSGFRVWASITYQQAVDSYTAQTANNVACFVVPEPSSISRDPRLRNDALNNISSGSDLQIIENESFTVYLFVPNQTTSGMDEYDLSQDIAPFIYSSLIGVKLPSGLAENRVFGVSLSGHGSHDFNKAVYVHAFSFETMRYITRPDAASLDESVAFRDINMDILNDFDETILTVVANLDDTPL